MRRKLLYLILSLQVVGLIVLYGYHRAALNGATYLLQTQPVDPRDYFRGDYIILDYEISSPPPLLNLEPFEGREVYVDLKPSGKFWVIDQISENLSEARMPFLVARCERSRLIYGLEKYFVPEGKGRPSGKLTMEITIRANGKGQVKQRYNDGKHWP